MHSLNLKEHLGHQLGTIGEALQARNEVAKLVTRLLVGEIFPKITLAGGFDSLATMKYYGFDQIAQQEHIQRVIWIHSILTTFPGVDGLEFEDGGIKSGGSIYRKTQGTMDIRGVTDVSRCRIIVPDLKTLFELVNFLNAKISDEGMPYKVFRVLNKYRGGNTSQTYYSGVFLVIGSVSSHPQSQRIIQSHEDAANLESIVQEVRRINGGNGGLNLWTLNENLPPNDKRRIRALKKEFDAIHDRYGDERKRIAQIHADLDVPTEIQVLTKRVRQVSEMNRKQYEQFSGRERKGVDFSEYNKLMLRAILYDWKEYFESNQINPLS